jgi:hypothetical protein
VRDGPVAGGLLLFGGALAVLGALATHDLGIATTLAALGAGLAALGVLVVLFPVVRIRPSIEAPLVGAPLVLLRESFESGPIGRQTIVSTVTSLEQAHAGFASLRMTPDEERRLISIDIGKFRAWLDEHLDRLEKET